MNYTKEEFFDLMEECEAQQAEHLDAICATRTFEFGGKVRPVTLRYCGHSAKFSVPYDSIVADARESRVEVCAVDDDMGRWPRFGGDRFGRKAESNA